VSRNVPAYPFAFFEWSKTVMAERARMPWFIQYFCCKTVELVEYIAKFFLRRRVLLMFL